MAERAVDLERHLALELEPAAEHRVMLALVGAVLLDRGDEHVVVGAPHAHRLEHTVDARIPPMLVIDVDRCEDVEITAAERGKHDAQRPRPERGLPTMSYRPERCISASFRNATLSASTRALP